MENTAKSSANRFRFRAWDKNRKIMIGSEYPNNWGRDKDEWYADIPCMQLTGIEEISINPNFVLMQSTGLTDRNGKDIYESDILGLKSSYLKDAWQIYTVDWRWKGFEKTSHNETFFTSYEPSFVELEIIGNVYESPSLLS